jgi:hypothetical protein
MRGEGEREKRGRGGLRTEKSCVKQRESGGRVRENINYDTWE